MNSSDLVARFFEILIGSLLVISGITHLNNPLAFFDTVLSYRITHGKWAVLIASFLPWFQVVVGISSLMGILRLANRWFVVALFSAFSFAQASAFFRGLEIDCGCFGPLSQIVSARSVALVLFFWLISIGVVVSASFQESLRSPNRTVPSP
jgi:hypothetical protein